jgi:uncharacterized protein (TIGR03067 family)
MNEEQARETKTAMSRDFPHEVVVQLAVFGFGTDAEFQRRLRIEDVVGAALEAGSNGSCTGGEGGSGTLNAFFSVRNPRRARGIILAALRDEGLLEGATVAFRRDTGEEESADWEVWWPEDFEGEFSLFGRPEQLGQPVALAPPWQQFPTIPARDPGWEAGEAGEYRGRWMHWYPSLDAAGRRAYASVYPLPPGWEEVYAFIDRRYPPLGSTGPLPFEPPPLSPDAAAVLERFRGTWRVDAYESTGGNPEEEFLRRLRFVYAGDLMDVVDGDRLISQAILRLDPSASPPTINVIPRAGPNTGLPSLGVYDLRRGVLRMASGGPGADRPADFDDADRIALRLMLRRQKNQA